MTNNKNITLFLPPFLVGLIDGIIVPMALYIFLWKVNNNQEKVWLIVLVAGIISGLFFAVAGYFTRKNQTDEAIQNRIINIYKNLDIDDSIREQMTSDTQAEQKTWNNEWNENSNASNKLSAQHYGICILSGYILGIIIIVINAKLITEVNEYWMATPVIILALSGFLKYKGSTANAFRGALIIALSGIIVFLGAFLVGEILN